MQICYSVYSYQNIRFVTRLRGGLISLIYERASQTRVVDSGEITAVAVMGTDVERIIYGFEVLHEIWASLVDIGIATWLLERQLSLACIAPVVLVIGTSMDLHHFNLTDEFVFSFCRNNL
jgi:ATP-binding cassette, subfamily C (CFTR/MRP), member 1